MLSYVDDCVYWYKYEELGKWSVDKLGNIFHVNFLGYAHWFSSIKTSQLMENYIPVDKSRYTTSVVEMYLENSTMKEN